jgi:hypothetical protein
MLKSKKAPEYASELLILGLSLTGGGALLCNLLLLVAGMVCACFGIGVIIHSRFSRLTKN